jgi:hypothetical protein
MRIGSFLSLPLDKLSKLPLQKHLDDIGKVKARSRNSIVAVDISRRRRCSTPPKMLTIKT